MLSIVVPECELFDEAKLEFIYVKRTTLQLEHSLVSVSKWESKWQKPFLGKQARTTEESIDYIRCMTLTQNVDPNVYLALTKENIQKVDAYINHPMTATWFSEDNSKKPNKHIITAEIIYYWMIAMQIPFECQKWHLNRLITLIRVCEAKNAPPKKMGMKDTIARYKALNEARRKAWGTKG